MTSPGGCPAPPPPMVPPRPQQPGSPLHIAHGHRTPEPGVRVISPLARHARTTSECSQADTIPDSVYSSLAGPLGSTPDIEEQGGDDDKPRSCCGSFLSCLSPAIILLKNTTFILFCIMNLLVCLAVALAYRPASPGLRSAIRGGRRPHY